MLRRKILKRTFSGNSDVLMREIFRYVNERNGIQSNPIQEPEEFLDGFLKVSGEDSLFIDNETRIILNESTKLHQVYGCWEEIYLTSLRFFEEIKTEKILEPEQADQLKSHLSKNFQELTLISLLNQLEKNLKN